MAEPRNAPAYAELLEWMEEAVEYVNKESRSPSLEEEGRKLLRRAIPPAKSPLQSLIDTVPKSDNGPRPTASRHTIA